MKRLGGIRERIRQYGYVNSLRGALKKILRFFGVVYESYYVLERDLDGEIKSFEPPDNVQVVRIGYQDFLESKFYQIFPQEKRDLYKKRFEDDAYEAYGVERDGKLLYLTWIATDCLEFENFGYKIEFHDNEGVLVDSLALPEARRMGLHKHMNGFRLKRLRDKGVKKVYVAMITENVPAIKTQLKHGFNRGEVLSGLRLGKKTKVFRRKIDWNKLQRI